MAGAPPEEHLDVLIIGAGLSGIGAAWHLQAMCPGRRYAIFESRGAMGGTWDLFRYPGIRSDSDMFTLGYRFHPWNDPKAIADGPSIKAYIEETARTYGIDRHIRYHHRIVGASWSSPAARWTVDMDVGGDGGPITRQRVTCGFLYSCMGYYDYERGYRPDFPGEDRFAGRIIHPQHWPEGLDYAGQRVVVIGSGATAVTLVPAMLEGPGAAAHVTMLQRSPTYVAELPSEDAIANALRRILPSGVAYALSRWKNILRSMAYFVLARERPAFFKKVLRDAAREALGKDFDVDTHFTPPYEPWDERLCIVPDGDLFRVLRHGNASIVTDRIATFDETGITLASGQHLDADLVVSATGLNVRILAGIALVVDGAPVVLKETMAYKGMMFSGIPNLGAAFGYTNASWTLKCDLVAQHICRLLNHMRAHGYVKVEPVRDPAVAAQPVLDFTSGYVQRALPTLPVQGDRAPWKLYQNYVKDLASLRWGRVDDPALRFTRG
jgi:cation diffusion facilitator CzcD-associated flavoprotein CzcO